MGPSVAYTCTCAAGYSGTNCETNVDECAVNPCQNGGTCTDGVDSYTCACAAGYSGTNCETDIDECAMGSAVCGAGVPCVNSTGSFTCVTGSCASYLLSHPGAPDGEYTLYVGSDIMKPATIYCHDMAGSPKEYLTLPQGLGVNYSQYAAGFFNSGTDVTTIYQRVRIDLAALQIITSDQLFSSSQGSLTHGSTTVTSMPYSTGMSCDADFIIGSSNANLTGTPFAFIPGSLAVGGEVIFGDIVFGNNDQNVDTSILGACAWASVTGASSPFNQNGPPLPIGYIEDECMLGTDNCDPNATCADTPGSFTCTCNASHAASRT